MKRPSDWLAFKHELRAKHANMNYRMLYFFHGQTAVVSHGFAKQEAAVPAGEIKKALEGKARFALDPKRHAHEE